MPSSATWGGALVGQELVDREAERPFRQEQLGRGAAVVGVAGLGQGLSLETAKLEHHPRVEHRGDLVVAVAGVAGEAVAAADAVAADRLAAAAVGGGVRLGDGDGAVGDDPAGLVAIDEPHRFAVLRS